MLQKTARNLEYILFCINFYAFWSYTIMQALNVNIWWNRLLKLDFKFNNFNIILLILRTADTHSYFANRIQTKNLYFFTFLKNSSWTYLIVKNIYTVFNKWLMYFIWTLNCQ
jgi:hypothetical protein